MAAVPDDWLTASLEEYRSLREESLQAIDRQLRILGLGTTALGVVLGLGVKAGTGSATATVLLVFFSPLLALLVCILWLGEMERMVRAGAHIASLEHRISDAIDPSRPAMSWERSLRLNRSDRRRVLSVYRSIFGILFLTAAVAAVLGVIGLSTMKHSSLLHVGLAAAFDAVSLLFLTHTFVATELHLRVLGGSRWRRDTMPKIANLIGYRRQLLALSSANETEAIRELQVLPNDHRSQL